MQNGNAVTIAYDHTKEVEQMSTLQTPVPSTGAAPPACPRTVGEGDHTGSGRPLEDEACDDSDEDSILPIVNGKIVWFRYTRRDWEVCAFFSFSSSSSSFSISSSRRTSFVSS
jgi:hypothetical protein